MITLDLSPLPEGAVELGAVAIIKCLYEDNTSGYCVRYNGMDLYHVIGVLEVERVRLTASLLEEWPIMESDDDDE